MRLRSREHVIAGLLLGAVATACGDTGPTPPVPLSVAAPAAALQLYGRGSHEGLVSACQAPGYRQFDFFVGHWNVTPIRLDGTPGFPAKSIMELELDDCVVEENWQGNARSINTYDPGTGTYNQQYVDVSGNHLLLEGGVQPDGVMKLTGTTFFFCPSCPNGAFPEVNVWTWTPFTPDSVRQLQLKFNGFNGAPRGRGFEGHYKRAASVTLGPTPTVGPCTSNPLFRQFDFSVGSWTITQGNAHGVLASNGGAVSAEVTRALADCLIEEKVDGPGGYRGWSFSAWNQSEDVWVRTYVSNLGDRTFLKGTLQGANLVLAGTRSEADGTMRKVRVTFAPDGDARVVETWEVSSDDGATYAVEQELVRIRRAG